MAEIASLTSSFASSLLYLLQFRIKQEKNNQAKAKQFKDAEEYTQQIQAHVDDLLKSDEAKLDQHRDELETLQKGLPQLRSDLTRVNSREQVEEFVKRLRKQADRAEDLVHDVAGSELSRQESDTIRTFPGTFSTPHQGYFRASLRSAYSGGPSNTESNPRFQTLTLQDEEQNVPTITVTGTSEEPDTATLFEALESKPSLARVHNPGQSEPRCDIILVHGTTGSARNTWCGRPLRDGRQFFWPRDLLARDLRDCAIWIYSYDSDIIRSPRRNKPIIDGLNECTEDLVKCVKQRIHSNTRQSKRHILWIAHSLGGLVVKNALIESQSEWGTTESTLASRTKGILFLGTPHAGSSLTARATRFAEIISLGTSDESLQDAKAWAGIQLHDSTSIVTIAARFSALMDVQNLPVVSFFETNPLLIKNGPRLVVEPFSRISHPAESVEYLEGNHLTMSRFDSHIEKGYQQVLKYLRSFLNRGDVPVCGTTRISRSRTPSQARTSLTDAEGTDVGTIYARLRLRIDRPATRWISAKRTSPSHGRWFTREGEFKSWLHPKELTLGRNPLLIIGPVGSGKTMISESIIQELSEQSMLGQTLPNTCLLQLFFKSGQAAQQSATTILVGFIAQMLDQNHYLARHISRHAEQFEVESNDTLSRALLKGTLRRMLEDNCWANVFVVIDALDECAESCVLSSCDVLAWMFDIDKIRMIFTSSEDTTKFKTFGIPQERTYSLHAKLEQELSKKGLKFEVKHVHRFGAWRAAMEDHINKALGLTVGQTREQNPWNEVSTSYRHDLRDRLCALLDQPILSFTLVTVVLQHLLFDYRHRSEKVSSQSLQMKIRLSSLTNIYIILIDLVNRQEDAVINALCILACAVEPLRPHEIVTLIHFVRSSDIFDQNTLFERTADLLRKLSVPEMRSLVVSDADGLHLARDLIRKALLSQMSAPGSHIRKVNYDPTFDIPVGLDEDLEPPMLQSNEMGKNIMHFRLARACLRILTGPTVSSSPPDSPVMSPLERTKLLPGAEYARANWKSHLRDAGELAIHLNDLVRRYLDTPGGTESGLRKGRADLEAFKILAHENLFQNLGAAFKNDSTARAMDISEIDGLLDDNRSPLHTDTLTAIEELEPVVHHDRLQHKIHLVKRITNGENTEFRTDIARFRLTTNEAAHLAEVSIREQNSETLDCVLESCRKQLQVSSRDLLAKAVKFQNPELVRCILQYRDLCDLQTALTSAVLVSNEEFCTELLRHGADVNIRDSEGSIALHLAAASGLERLVKLFLQWNASLNLTDAKGRTALHLAAEHGHTGVAEVLIINSASPFAKDRSGRTPFFIACACGHIDTARLLHREGARLDDHDLQGRTPLHAAARKGQTEIVEMLLKAGVNPSVRNDSGITPLHEAAECGWDSIIELLLRAGANVNHVSSGNATALHFACTCDKAAEPVVQLLLDNKADSDALDSLGRSPLLLAGHFSTLRVLIRLMKDQAQQTQRDFSGYNLKDYVTYPVHLSEEEEQTLSESSKRRLIDGRKTNQKEKMTYLHIEDVMDAAPPWDMVELRKLQATSDSYDASRDRRPSLFSRLTWVRSP